MSKTILITGGPVHAYIDAVKIVTNRFKGGLMAKLADQLAETGEKVTYLASRDSANPECSAIELVTHDGFYDYRLKVRRLAEEADAVILGAAVANLIPDAISLPDGTALKLPLKEKFPSHLFKPGDAVPMTWQISPRIIDEVKKVMKPEAHLFGFKLLSGVSHEELISAAYGVLLESGATAVFANDAKDLENVYAVTKERGVHPLSRRNDDLPRFILRLLDDVYYRTSLEGSFSRLSEEALAYNQSKLRELIELYKDKFVTVDNGMVFGTVARRIGTGLEDGFITTGRGKRETDDFVVVSGVDHERRLVFSYGKKATLNAPLLAFLFARHPRVQSIVHYHQQHDGLPTYSYAPPGTLRDSLRLVDGSFNIEGHGAFILLDEFGSRR